MSVNSTEAGAVVESQSMTHQTIKIFPRDGETVLCCDHVGPYSDKGLAHVYGMPESEFTRPDGSSGRSRWLVVCGDCRAKSPEDPTPFIRTDYRWIGDEPVAVTRAVQ